MAVDGSPWSEKQIESIGAVCCVCVSTRRCLEAAQQLRADRVAVQILSEYVHAYVFVADADLCALSVFT